MPSDLTYFTIKHDHDVLCVTFNNRDLGLDDVPKIHTELEQAVASCESPHIILSLENVHYLPATALGIMVATLTRIRRKDGEMRLACLDEHLRELMRIGRLDRIFEIYPTVTAALDSFQS